MEAPGRHRVYLEIGSKRVFACSVDWPGWARSGRNEEQALETLAAYADRFAVVAEEASLPFTDDVPVEVIERVPGSGSTDFGAPGAVPQVDYYAVAKAEAERQAALVRAAWSVFDRVVGSAPAALRKGPRGGGRDRDAVAAHELGAEAADGRSIGVRHREPAWHVLDHAWEIEDKAS